MSTHQSTSTPPTSLETFAIFPDAPSFEDAVTALWHSGYDQRRFSVLAQKSTVEEKFGDRLDRINEVDENADLPRTAFVDRASKNETKAMALGAIAYVGAVSVAGAVVVAGGSAIAAGVAALAAGSGGALMGEGLNRLVGERDSLYLQDRLEDGDIAVWVNVADEDENEEVKQRLKEAGASFVGEHWVALKDSGRQNPLSGKAVDPFLSRARV